MMEEDFTYVLRNKERDYGRIVLELIKNLMRCLWERFFNGVVEADHHVRYKIGNHLC